MIDRASVIACGFIVMVASNVPGAESVGYVFEGDLNGDGLVDNIQSGPTDGFGLNYPFLVTLSGSDDHGGGSLIVWSVGHEDIAIQLEDHFPVRVWTITTSGGALSAVNCYSLESPDLGGSLRVHLGDQGSTLGADIVDVIFTDQRRVSFNEVVDHSPPSPPGGSWYEESE